MNGILLSDAIRLGSMLGPQTRRAVFELESHCALGSAALATGFNGERTIAGEEAIEHLRNVFPLFSEKVRPVGPNGEGLGYLIGTRNDQGHTREQIADWLVESGNDCSSVEIAPAKDVAAKLISEHMVAK